MFNIYNYLSKLSPILRNNSEYVDDIADSFSKTQLQSKQWLVEEMCKVNTKTNPEILILGGWYGSYLVPMLRDADFNNITLTDINPKAVNIASQLHNCSTFVLNAVHPAQTFNPDIVINTSCEHMMTIGDAAVDNPDCLYVLQSCDNPNDPGHINISTNTDDFVKKTGLSRIVFRGRINLGHKNRFMVIGYK